MAQVSPLRIIGWALATLAACAALSAILAVAMFGDAFIQVLTR